MMCPHCGFALKDASPQLCPRCGQPVFTEPAHTTRSEQFSTGPTLSSSPQGQSGFSSPATAQWMKPSLPPAPVTPKPNRRRRRTILSIIVTIAIIGVCVGYGYVVFFVHVSPPASATTIVPGTTDSLFSDPLTSNINGWSTNTNHCFFQDSAYHIKNSVVCFAPYTHSVGDVSITVQAKQVAGPLTEPYGIIFRASNRLAGSSDSNWYEFALISDRLWGFSKFVNGTGSVIVDETINAAINGDLNASNTLMVQASGSHFVFFINGTQVGEATDSTFTSGAVGLFVGTDTEVAYTNFEITTAS